MRRLCVGYILGDEDRRFFKVFEIYKIKKKQKVCRSYLHGMISGSSLGDFPKADRIPTDQGDHCEDEAKELDRAAKRRFGFGIEIERRGLAVAPRGKKSSWKFPSKRDELAPLLHGGAAR